MQYHTVMWYMHKLYGAESNILHADDERYKLFAKILFVIYKHLVIECFFLYKEGAQTRLK